MEEQHQKCMITASVTGFLKKYPRSRLEDIYKGFFQDEYGPGHLLKDPDGSKKYLQKELVDMKSHRRYEAEPCGTGQNFFRISLDLIVDGLVTTEDYFHAFQQSAASFQLPHIVSWARKWEYIELKIRCLQNQIEGYSQSLHVINKNIHNGIAVAHHSPAFIENYDPHYRIFHREVMKRSFNEYFLTRTLNITG